LLFLTLARAFSGKETGREAIKKPAGTAAGILSFKLQNRSGQDPSHTIRPMMTMAGGAGH